MISPAPKDESKEASVSKEAVSLFVRISNEHRTSTGIDSNASEIEACDISLLKTVPFYMAEEIQHDIDEYLRMNAGKFADIATNELPHLPSVEEIATPIYIVTVLDGTTGRIEYIGKAASKKNRFAGGHAVAMRLHHPKYKPFEKFISFATITISTTKKGKFPIDWVSPIKLRDKILNHVEHALIWKFQPFLNTYLKDSEPLTFSFLMNLNGTSDEFVRIGDIRVRARNAPIIKGSPDVSACI